jgi:hypothetical protein
MRVVLYQTTRQLRRVDPPRDGHRHRGRVHAPLQLQGLGHPHHPGTRQEEEGGREEGRETNGAPRFGGNIVPNWPMCVINVFH